ncbi:DNA cytosine methyltransferase [Alteromonas sp. MYP5]|uniref:DNA (cytosine-5-)-methyltransferase n=2 Tax=Alteromonas ponticola TaxID=2720613 RepID=A0ABX1R5C6_9ALTE|nr:DNA cytosine methyltransferase [Alteromonas ponticola]
MIVMDFFSGCGGASQGLRQAGCDIVLGLDFDKDAAASYRANFPEAAFFEGDIREIPEEDVSAVIRERNPDNQPLLMAACAPCQPFSSQNKFKYGEDARRTLLDETHRFIHRLLPDYILIENVPGIQKVDENAEGPYRRFISLLTDLNYQYKAFIARSEDYGVPQKRKRFVLLASRLGEISEPLKTHGDGLEPYATVRDYIEGYSKLEAGSTCALDKLHVSAEMKEINLTRIMHTPEGGDRRDWPEHLVNKCHKNYKGHTDTYGRMSWHLPAPTLTTKCHSYSNGRFGHPDIKQNRAISIREASRLQTFPDNYVFHGSLGSMARQIGNAVPCRLAESFGISANLHYQNYLDMD